jgi:UDP-glucose 4-epimerase
MRLLITGISGYLGGLLLKALDEDDSVEKVIGIDVQEPAFMPDKLEFHRGDVRDPGLKKYMEGADAVLHMAFILDEIKDKTLTDDININGSRNVFDCAIEAGVPWIVFLSSMAAFAGYPDNHLPIMDDDYPRGHRGIYYTYAKAEMEHYLRYLRERHPALEVTVLRPCVIAGPNIKNTVVELFSQPFAARPRGCNPETQLITEEALVSAIMLVLKKHAVGNYNVTSDDYITLREMMKVSGTKAPQIPLGFLCRIVDAAFKLGASPVSAHWIRMLAYQLVGSNEKIKRELGWEPGKTTMEIFKETFCRR